MTGWVSGLTEDPNDVIRSKPKKPTGYESSEAFLLEMRTNYDNGKSFNQHNQDAGEEDARFQIGEQWEPVVEQARRALRKPVLTFNRLVAFMAQIVGNRLMNETEIRVYPDKSGTKAAAELRESIIRSIYKNSAADFARDEAMKYQVIGGQGAFCLRMEFTSDDVFTQDIKLGAITNPYAATWDPMAVEPSGGDAEWATVEDDIPTDVFKARWPWAAETSFSSVGRWNDSGYWLQDDTIRVVSYWRMVTEGYKTLALFLDGTTHDVTKMEEYEYIHLVDTKSDGSPYTRRVANRFARMYVCSGQDILEGPFDYPLSSIPVYRVPGWEISEGKRVHRFGLTRFLKDPARLDNYFMSMRAEQLVAAPRNKWLTTPEAVKGHEQRWRRSPTSDDPFLFFNDGEMAPVHIPPPGVDSGLMNESLVMTQALKDISNIHEANMGMPSNEVSGKAIQQRQSISDVGSYIYHDRLRIADERCARNINELIPYIYDTHRMMAIVGRDNKTVMAVINDPSNPDSDVTIGKYGVTVSVGPATETKRQLASEQMMAFVNAIPGSADKVMDLIAESQDWPKSDEFVRRFRMMLPAGVIPTDEMTDEEKAMAQQNQQMQEVQQKLAMALQHAELSDKEAQANLRTAQAEKARADAYKAQSDANARTSDVQGKNQERQVSQAMGAIDQHNQLEAEDRDHALAVDGQAHDQALAADQQEHDQSKDTLTLMQAADKQIHDQRIATQNARLQKDNPPKKV
jgi:hypothetical protein